MPPKGVRMRWLVLSAIIFFGTLMAAGLVALAEPDDAGLMTLALTQR
jgi:hypothetical protein